MVEEVMEVIVCVCVTSFPYFTPLFKIRLGKDNIGVYPLAAATLTNRIFRIAKYQF